MHMRQRSVQELKICCESNRRGRRRYAIERLLKTQVFRTNVKDTIAETLHNDLVVECSAVSIECRPFGVFESASC